MIQGCNIHMRGNNECCTLYVNMMQILIQNKTMYIYVCMLFTLKLREEQTKKKSRSDGRGRGETRRRSREGAGMCCCLQRDYQSPGVSLNTPSD